MNKNISEMITSLRHTLNEVTNKLADNTQPTEIQESSAQLLIALKSLLDHYAEGITKMTTVITETAQPEKTLRSQVEQLAEELGDNIKGFRTKLNPRLVNKGVGQLPPNVGQIIRAVIDYTEESTLKNIQYLGTKSELDTAKVKITDKLEAMMKAGDPYTKLEDAKVLLAEYKNLRDQAAALHLKMLENQSFQDLTGQALQLLIWLVNSVENNLKRIAEENQLKVPEKKEGPKEVLLDSQSAIDDLLG